MTIRTCLTCDLDVEWDFSTLAAPAEGLDTIDGCIAIVQQSLDTVRGEDDGESRTIKTSIAAREHVIALLTAYREQYQPAARAEEPSDALPF